MKKLLLIFCFIFIFSSCSFWTNENNNEENISYENIDYESSLEENIAVWEDSISSYIDSDTVEELWLEEAFYSENNYSYFEYMDWGKLLYDMAIKNNLDFFESNPEEIEFFYVFRNYVFWDNYEIQDQDLNEFLSCLEWNISYEEVSNEDFSLFCEWKDSYIVEDWNDFNYWAEKDSLTTLKDIREGADISCDYFTNLSYEFANPLYFHYYKLDNYLACKKIKDPSYSISDSVYFYRTAMGKYACEALIDNNLQKFCNYELENTNTNSQE